MSTAVALSHALRASPLPIAGEEGARAASALEGKGAPFLARILDAGPVEGALQPGASIADLTWFKTGGPAECLFRPRNPHDLCGFLAALDPAVPILPLGLGSNLIVRDGGVPGVVIRLGKPFADIRIDGLRVHAGAGAPGIAVASAARDAGLGGLEFLRGIPGAIGGAVAMNAGAYGREIADCLIEATVITRDGRTLRLGRDDLGFSYRHSELPERAIVIDALFEGVPGEAHAIGAEMDRIAAEREASQPLRTRTGGSTFKNPPGAKAWELIDRAGCRGLRRGGALVSEKHCNFLIAGEGCTSADLEALGDEVRARVAAATGVALEWEIARVGVAA